MAKKKSTKNKQSHVKKRVHGSVKKLIRRRKAAKK